MVPTYFELYDIIWGPSGFQYIYREREKERKRERERDGERKRERERTREKEREIMPRVIVFSRLPTHLTRALRVTAEHN